MTKKFYKQEVHRMAGPGKEDLNFLAAQTEISKEEAEKILDDFFEDGGSNAEKMRLRAWKHIMNGASVTVEDTCISYKN